MAHWWSSAGAGPNSATGADDTAARGEQQRPARAGAAAATAAQRNVAAVIGQVPVPVYFHMNVMDFEPAKILFSVVSLLDTVPVLIRNQPNIRDTPKTVFLIWLRFY